MEYLFALLALVVIYITGTTWVNALVPGTAPARNALVSGNGILLGLVIVPLLMRLLSLLGFPLTFPAILSASLVCTLVALALTHAFTHKDAQQIRVPGEFSGLSMTSRIFSVVLISLLVFRFGTLGLELLWRPLFPFDAAMHWATKSRVWYEHAMLVPFVPNDIWLASGGGGSYTDHHPDYPITIPLLQVWMSTAVGYWNESLMNLPYLLCYLGLGLAFFSQARTAGASSLIALIFTYMLLSLPLLNTHIALAGYADLLLAACYCAAIMALYNWSVDRCRWQAILAIVFAFSCPLIKSEGLFWLLTFIPGLAVAFLPWRKGLMLLVFLLVCLLVTLVVIPRDLQVAGHSLDSLRIYFRPGTPAAIFKSLWIHDNWHLFGYMLVIALPLVWFVPKSSWRNLSVIATSLVSAVILFLTLYLYTRHYLGAIRFTSVGRLSLQLVPALMFLCLLVYTQIYNRVHGKHPMASQVIGGQPDTDRQEPA